MPYWRISGYYFFYFAALGALAPYWGLYLKDRGFDALAIGQLMAILVGTKIVAPIVWGQLVDHGGRRMPLVRAGSLLALVSFLPVFVADGFWAFAAVIATFSFFWNASLPQMEAVTFNHLGSRVSRYARIRLWGSIGFILVVGALGLQLGHRAIGIVPVWVLVLFAGIWLSTLAIPDSGPVQAADPTPSLRRLIKRPEVQAFLTACFLMQLSHGAYYAFYSIHLEAAGYPSAAVGGLWALGVTAEVLIFLRMHWLLARFGTRRVLIWSLGLAAVRWLLIGGFVDILAVQIIAQTLHAATFGTFHAAAIHLAHHFFPGRTQGRGQALYNSLSFGAGGAAGSLLAGHLWGSAGPFATFGVGAAAAVLGLVAVWARVDRGGRY